MSTTPLGECNRDDRIDDDDVLLGEWVEYGKSYYQLRCELSQKGESIVGVQVDIQRSEKYPALCRGGLHLVGDVETGSVISGGERFEEIDSVHILRYRRLLTAFELEE